MPQWFEAARAGEIADDECKSVSLNGSSLALFNLDGEYFRLEDVWSHMNHELTSHWVDCDRAVCPWLLAEFSVRIGEALKASAYEGVRLSGPRPSRDRRGLR